MTHEELVEKVAEVIYRTWAANFFEHSPAEWSELVSLDHSHVELARREARAAIKIVGEACAADVPLIASQSEYGAKPATDSTMLTITAIQSAILSLTQGTKE